MDGVIAVSALLSFTVDGCTFGRIVEIGFSLLSFTVVVGSVTLLSFIKVAVAVVVAVDCVAVLRYLILGWYLSLLV